MDLAASFFALAVAAIYLVGVALLFYILILAIQALRLTIQALKKYLLQP